MVSILPDIMANGHYIGVMVGIPATLLLSWLHHSVLDKTVENDSSPQSGLDLAVAAICE